MEFTFAEFASQSIFTEPLKNPFNMGDMLFGGFGEDEDIIKVNEAKDIEEFTKTIVGVCLKGRRSIGEAKGHDKIFVVTVARAESGFIFITGSNAQLVICILHIQPGEIFGALESIE